MTVSPTERPQTSQHGSSDAEFAFYSAAGNMNFPYIVHPITSTKLHKKMFVTAYRKAHHIGSHSKRSHRPEPDSACIPLRIEMPLRFAAAGRRLSLNSHCAGGLYTGTACDGRTAHDLRWRGRAGMPPIASWRPTPHETAHNSTLTTPRLDGRRCSATGLAAPMNE